jgi:hypothetical protein
MLLLLPADPLDDRRVDPFFLPEAEAAESLGYRWAPVAIDALAEGDRRRCLRRLGSAAGDGEGAWYRGWMLRSEHYVALAEAIQDRGGSLHTSPTTYRAAHELPQWIAGLAGLTAPTVWLAGADLDALTHAASNLPPGPGILKDWVKSAKGYWDEACFVPNVHAAEDVQRVASRFVALRGDDLVGGLVVRSFEPYESGEVRTWWRHGLPTMCSAHPDTPNLRPPSDLDLNWLRPAVTSLGLDRCTVDLARHRDGRWRVIEIGDAGVSDRPSTLTAHELLSALWG